MTENRMKKKKSIIVVFASLLIFSACENMLDINPSDKYNIETFWKTKEHASAGLTGCYNALLPWKNEHFVEFDMLTSNSMPYNEANDTQAISKGEHLSNNQLVAMLWKNCFIGIGRTNTFIQNVPSIKMDEALKARMIGEAKFLRAFYYFNLTDKFGDVPLILEMPNADKHASLPRDPKAKVVEQILKDLTEAAAVLPGNFKNADLGRVTKGAALALKARVLLYNEKWEQAAATAKEVINLKQYGLFNDYRRFFREENKHNEEVIFNIESKLPEFPTGYDHNLFRLNRPAPLKELVDLYLMKDGKSIKESPLFDPAKPYENRDPRLQATITCIGYPYNGKILKKEDLMTTGFGVKKYTTYEDSVEIPLVDVSAFNPILIRYAEVLLTYAEAQNEVSGPDASVYNAINQIRRRPSVAMPEVTSGLNQEQMRQTIRLERRIELAFEGLYYSDILRWKIAEKENNGAMHNWDNVEIVKRRFDPKKDYLWPIPFNQIVLNPNLTQNPNWN